MSSVVASDVHVLCAYVALLAVVGSLGNFIILLVYCKRRDRKATNVFISTLAGLDLCVCLVVMPYTIVHEYHIVTSEFACKVGELTRHFNVCMSNLTLVAVAAERYVAICKPTFTVTARHVQKCLIIMVLISIFFSIPSVLIFAVVSEPLTSTANETSLMFNSSNLLMDARSYCMFTESIIGQTYSRAYQGFQMVVCFSCFVAIIVLYIFVYRIAWKRGKARRLGRVYPAAWTTSQAGTTMSPTHRDHGFTQPEKRKSVFLRILNIRTGTSKITRTNVTTFEQNELPEVSPPVAGSEPRSGIILAKKSNSSKTNAHRKTGTMLFLCTVVYFITWMPFWLDVFGATKSLSFRYMFFISNASNPVIYGIVNKQVRNAMSKIICQRKSNMM